MNNPLLSVPLNTQQSYVMAKTNNGCEVYMPVDSRDNVIVNGKKRELAEYLYSLGGNDNGGRLA